MYIHILLFLGTTGTLLLGSPITAKRCYYCKVTDASRSMNIMMTCEEVDNCYISQEAAVNLAKVTNKECLQLSYHGQQQHEDYLRVTYKLSKDLCSAIPIEKPHNAASITVASGQALIVLLGFLL
ncbi:sperm acrosome membrane-associated protein 4-like [Antechinus flavipes]|uniref:sperm acrosome membrane-associated protein 4-like n=1 Tax=Antechinus flavipes TaxID=38775 RepID=UPI00223599FB|nr:sperm acrosome membrane-associated protein 4-like [Antechinus flavipes]